jgi:hypothetical protein
MSWVTTRWLAPPAITFSSSCSSRCSHIRQTLESPIAHS